MRYRSPYTLTPMRGLAVAIGVLCLACAREEPEPVEEPAEVLWSEDTPLTAAEIEAGRRDSSWREALRLDRRGPIVTADLDTIAIPETWGDIREAAGDPYGDQTVHLPLFGDVEGPSVLYVQILLDRARFSPGVLDGKWGKNTEKAVYWFQHREGLPPSGVVDSLTLEHLHRQGGAPERYLTEHVLTEDDVAGPFVDIPDNVYAQRRLDCMCYESLSEKLGERFHATPAVLAEMNPARVLDSLAAGDTLLLPDLGPPDPAITTPDTMGTAPGGPVIARLVVSGQGYYVHALDESGRIVYHFPTTLGSRYDPSPEGELEIVSITADPWFHYQPQLLSGVDKSKPSTLIPPGPNNPVGSVWIKLSRPHYGIHGTREPATIGYDTSSGCVRLTNWDAAFLSLQLQPRTTVAFVDTRPVEADTVWPGGAARPASSPAR